MHADRQTHTCTHRRKNLKTEKQANRDGHLGKDGHRREFQSDASVFSVISRKGGVYTHVLVNGRGRETRVKGW